MARKRILIVEDDKVLANVLAYNLEQAGYEVTHVTDGAAAIQSATDECPDLIVLDLMLPLVDGFDVCRRLREDANTRDVLVMILSARAAEADQLLGFRVGADDYVTKPFSTKVLVERIKALLRRPEVDGSGSDVIDNQGIRVDRVRHRVVAGGNVLELTFTEFSLLEVLIRQPGRAFTRSELIDAALGDTIVMERTIDVHVLSLRRKLGRFADLIETVRGIGYRFREPERTEAVTWTLPDGVSRVSPPA